MSLWGAEKEATDLVAASSDFNLSSCAESRVFSFLNRVRNDPSLFDSSLAVSVGHSGKEQAMRLMLLGEDVGHGIDLARDLSIDLASFDC